jgi:hypothetical protein
MKPRSFLILLAFLLTPAIASAFDFSAHGYYRVRFEYTHDLDLQTPNAGIVPGDVTNSTNDRFGAIAYGQQRFRVNPELKLNDHVSFHGQFDIFDNLLFGQSQVSPLALSNPIIGTLKLPQANGPMGVIGTSGGDLLGSGGGNINFRRLWVDVLTSGGQFRIGRQPSQFGLGIFNNDGDSEEGDFGDTYDRILYLAGIDVKNGDRVNFGVAYDFAYEGQRDPSVFGLDDSEPSNWNDGYQGGMLFMYQADAFEIGMFGGLRYRNGKEGAYTTTATYIDNCADDGRPAEDVCTTGGAADPAFDLDNDGRTDDGIVLPAGKDGDTFLYIADVYGKFRFLNDYSFSFEGVYVGGKIATGLAVDAIVLDATTQAGLNNPLTAPIELPLTGSQNSVQAILAATEFEADWDFGGEFNVQAGYASGDGKPMSEQITQIGFRPDYDVALILFDQPVGTSPAVVIGGVTELGRVPMSPNYINNAIFFTAEYKQEFDITGGIPWAEDFKVGIKGITAYAPENNLDLNFTEITGVANLPYLVNKSRWYGFEVDSSIEATFFDVMHWKTTVGAFVPGPLYDIKNDNGSNDPTGFIDAILFDKANIAFAGKTTLFFEF